MKKKCTICGLASDDLELFVKQSDCSFGRTNKCKQCNSKRVRRSVWYAQRKARNVLLVQGLKNKPCADCGMQYHSCVMQFDHVRGTKKYDMGTLAYSCASTKTILAEAEKCEVVCANCHAVRTYSRSHCCALDAAPPEARTTG